MNRESKLAPCLQLLQNIPLGLLLISSLFDVWFIVLLLSMKLQNTCAILTSHLNGQIDNDLGYTG
jgi:hypothetical protein